MQHPSAARPPAVRVDSDPGLGRALAVAGTWAAASLALVLSVSGVPSIGELGVFLLALGAPTLLTALAVRVVARGRAWPFWLLLVVAAPVFWLLRALQNLVVG